jgi:hypothetical protein
MFTYVIIIDDDKIESIGELPTEIITEYGRC